MNRRTFLRSSAAATATLSSGPLLLGTDDKAGSKAPRVGTGEHTYECDHNFGELPPDYAWQTTHNVAVDSEGLVYVTHQGLKVAQKNMDCVMVFDPKGKFVRSFGQDWHGGGHGVEIRKEGSDEFIYLTNTWTEFNKIVKTNLKGEIVWVKGRPECKEYDYRIDPKDKRRISWPAFNPTNVSWLPDGGFTVGDGYGSNYLLNYDKDGKLTKVFSGPGTAPGKCQTPHGNWLDTRDAASPAIVVCDRANARLQRFSLDGKPLSATEPNKVVFFPAHAKTRGDVLLVPDLHARVSLFDRENKPIVHLGDDEAWRKKVLDGFKVRGQPKEWLPGKFVHPHDACFDAAGNIFVVEWVATGRVSFLRKA